MSKRLRRVSWSKFLLLKIVRKKIASATFSRGPKLSGNGEKIIKNLNKKDNGAVERAESHCNGHHSFCPMFSWMFLHLEHPLVKVCTPSATISTSGSSSVEFVFIYSMSKACCRSILLVES